MKAAAVIKTKEIFPTWWPDKNLLRNMKKKEYDKNKFLPRYISASIFCPRLINYSVNHPTKGTCKGVTCFVLNDSKSQINLRGWMNDVHLYPQKSE